jgi:glycosyltransferase involved in cell wall biosynthesis
VSLSDSTQRIAIIAASMRLGGAERMTLNLAGELVRRGCIIDLVLIDRTGPLLEQVPPNIRVIGLGSSRARGAVRQLRSYLRCESPAAVLSIAFQTNILTMLASIGLRPKPRIVLSVRSTYSAAMAANRLMTRAIFKTATRLLYPRADRIVAVSKGAGDDLCRNTNIRHDKVVTVYNPVIRSDFDRLAAEPADLLDDVPGVARIITVGRLTRAKDQANLIRAFAKVVQEMPAQLLIAGEGELRIELEQVAKSLGVADDVRFLGMVRNPYPYLRASDLFVLSSIWEGLPSALVEAMASGLPVVSTDCPHGPREILEGGKWGRRVPPGEPAALAQAMLDVLRSGGVDARERARGVTAERAASRYLDLLIPGAEDPGLKSRSD